MNIKEKTENILVVNSGSSSIKLALFNQKLKKKIFFNCQALNYENCSASVSIFNNNSETNEQINLPKYKLEMVISFFINYLIDKKIINNRTEINKIGHRFVQGGEIFKTSVEILEKDYHLFEYLNPFAPLHNPINFFSYKLFKKELLHSRHVAVFDTSFHQTIKKEQFIYPIPYRFYEKYKIRKYGFHGTSYRYILEKCQKILKKQVLNLIICHIGAGSSIAAIKENKSINTTMGISPLGGLMMGTRSGDLDPSVLEFMSNNENLNINKIIKILNNDSGLKGVSCLLSGDVREILKKKKKNKRANLAWNMFINKISNFIAQYYFQLNGEIDGLILTAGIGENSSDFREDIFKKINPVFGFNKINKKIDDYFLFSENKKTKFLIVPTNEEIVIASDTIKILN